MQNRSFVQFCFFLFSVIYFTLNYSYLLNFPYGIHFTRQTDSAAFSLYYLHQNNFNFFDIGNLNLDFESGKAACEFPVFYYLYFLIFKFTGIRWDIIRGISLFLTCGAIYSINTSLYKLFKNVFITISVTTLALSSSVFRYYSVNMLPDSIALAFTLNGLGYILHYHFHNELSAKSFLNALVSFTLAGLLKAYYGIYLLIFAAMLLPQLKLKSKKTLALVLSGSSIAAWYLYSIYYNKVYHSNYYLTNITPIWKLTWQEIIQTYNYMSGYWYTKYYHPSSFHLFIALLLVLFILTFKKTRNLKFLCLLVGAMLVYVVLFFKQFKDHDYYFLPLIPGVVILVTLAVLELIEKYPQGYAKHVVVTIIFLIGTIAFNYTSLNMHRRLNTSIDTFSEAAYYLWGGENQLNQLGIPPSSKFIVIGDKTPNGSLAAINRFGWTYRDFKTEKDKIMNAMQQADYLLIVTPSKYPIPEEFKRLLDVEHPMSFNVCLFYKVQKPISRL